MHILGSLGFRLPFAPVLLALVAAGCGGVPVGGGDAGGEVTWPEPDGGMTTELPPSVNIVRIVFESVSGESCCVAVDPAVLGDQSSGAGLAVLADLPAGPATVVVAGFPTNFAPAVPGIVDTCTTQPPDVAQACDPVRAASPAFSSDPIAVTIIAGSRTEVGEVPMQALPFLLDFAPPQDSFVTPPVQFDFTVVDALTTIPRDSVDLDVSFDIQDDSGFRRVTKRVTLEFEDCDDDSDAPCSPEGNQSLAGLKASGVAPELPVGEVEAHIVAENESQPPRELDFRYSFNVLATPTATATATATPSPATPAAGAETATNDGAAAAAPAGKSDSAGNTDDYAGRARAIASPTPTATPGGE